MSRRDWSEDILAILLGAGILCLALVAYLLLPLLTEDVQAVLTVAAEANPGGGRPAALGNDLSALLDATLLRLIRWDINPLQAFSSGSLMAFTGLTAMLGLGLSAAVAQQGYRPLAFLVGFLPLSLLALVAYLLGAQTEFRSVGLGYALWSILLGLLVSNLLGLPAMLKPALRHELYVKTGLILLGAEVLLNKILAIGLPGIFVAWVVTPCVLVLTYWFGQHILKMESKTLNITISADMSVCGVSAAIATAAACKAKKEELTTAIGLSMVFTSIMMVAMPVFIRAVGMPEVLGGAWIGGTIDATGAVVAAGAFLGDTAMSVAATIKMIQNIMIGVMAFAVAVYWSARVETTAQRSINASEIWHRFPKFVLGFIGTSVIFSLLHQGLADDTAAALLESGVIAFSVGIRDWLFCLAFVSIGLATNFKELRSQFSGGKPLVLYLCGQGFNLALTLLMAWIMFYHVFPEITNAL
jgi:uncharacterized membrane protein YadS